MYYEKIEKVLTDLKTGESGLSSEEAAKRKAEYGENALAKAKKKTLLQKFFAQFRDVMVIVLLAAAIVSAAVALYQKTYGDLLDSAIILFIVILNAIIGLIQENKAENALEYLKNLNKPYSKVFRDGKLCTVKSEEIVPGDVVQLDAGDIVPADMRLIASGSLKVEESALTGESVPSEKDFSALPVEGAALGDRANTVFSSGVVVYGRGKGVVTETGMNTEVGKIAKMLQNDKPQTTPLQKQLNKTAKYLSIGVLVIAVIIFIFSVIRQTPVIDAFMTAVAIAVAAIPEGLPAVVTIVLAIGVQRMSKRNAIVKNLPAVETLGCCEVICSDKTGTLTLNKMTVKKIFTVQTGVMDDADVSYGGDAELLIRAAALCNDSELSEDGGLVGDPTETALVSFAIDKGINFDTLRSDWKRFDEIPFDSVRKLMTTANESGKEKLLHIKGAPDILLKRCKYYQKDGETLLMTDDIVEKIQSANREMASKALRVLGVAVKTAIGNKGEWEENMMFVGLIGMIDPPRPEAKEAVKVCRGAGIRPIMITGDHMETALAIAREIGIGDGKTVTSGRQIDEMDDNEFEKTLEKCSVFARVSPENKVRIVNCFKKKGIIVAMTGDGVNDAPSIKAADIGIGMGITGTEVSKGAADMILADDNFATIVSATEEGRKIYANIKKVIQFLLSANIAEVLCLFIATMCLPCGETFLTPVMILWVNLITDTLPAFALGLERAERDVMLEKPRKSGSSLFAGKTGLDIMIQGFMQTALVLAVFFIGYSALGNGPESHAEASTMAFISLCFIQLFHSYNLRSQKSSIFTTKVFDNKWLNLSFLTGGILVSAIVLLPFLRSVFDVTALSGIRWLIAIGLSFMIIPLVELQKAIERFIDKRRKK